MGTAAATSRENFQEYFDNWSFGTVVDRAPDELLDRDQILDKVLRRAYLEPAFRHQLLSNTRLVWAIILEEAQSLKRSGIPA